MTTTTPSCSSSSGRNGDNNSYCDAAPVYTQVVKLNPQPTAKYLKEAAYAAVISWKNCLAVDDDGQEQRPSQDDMKKKQQESQEARRAARRQDEDDESLLSRSRSPRTSRR